MPEIKLGNKYDCYSCGTKFYDLGKAEPICPKCAANQKDASQNESTAAPSKRKRKVDTAKVVDIDEVESPIADISDDEMVGPDLEDDDIGDDDEDEDLDEEV